MASEIEILTLASAAPHGIAVLTSDFSLARRRLYKALRAQPSLWDFELRKAPNGAENELWIIPAGSATAKPPEALKGLPSIEDLGL